jgi:predicted nucleic acid-binding protein
MPNSDKKILITDTSVLINFLNIDRLDLLTAFPGKFLITGHVVDEITMDFPDQQTRLNAAITSGQLEVIAVDGEQELQLYNELIKERRLGAGECSAIACAINRKYSLAMEDSRACKKTAELEPLIEILKTQDIMVRLIINGVIAVEEADLIKTDWQENYRFALKFRSFFDLTKEYKKE